MGTDKGRGQTGQPKGPARALLMIENRASETIHFRMTALAGPSAKEKLLERFGHAEFRLTQIATRAIDGVQIDSNRGFITLCHTLYVAMNERVVKAQSAAALLHSYCV